MPLNWGKRVASAAYKQLSLIVLLHLRNRPKNDADKRHTDKKREEGEAEDEKR